MLIPLEPAVIFTNPIEVELYCFVSALNVKADPTLPNIDFISSNEY